MKNVVEHVLSEFSMPRKKAMKSTHKKRATRAAKKDEVELEDARAHVSESSVCLRERHEVRGGMSEYSEHAGVQTTVSAITIYTNR